MTTYKGIAATTQTLGYLAGAAVLEVVPEARVTLARPEEPAAGSANEPRVNIYLVQVLPDPMMRSNDLPTRDDRGHLLSTPLAPVNLRYLLSFFGASEKAHLMLGAVELALRSHAVLDRTLIGQALAAHPELQDSGLEAQIPPVRMVPSNVTLEELARFWSGFLQMPYTVSTLYEAMTVILSAADTPIAALPVRQVGGRAGGLPPQFDRLPTVQYSAQPPATVVPITGTGLRDQQPVSVAGQWTALQPTPTGFELTLPTGIPAGAQPVILGTQPPGQATPEPIPGSQPQLLRIRPELLAATVSGGGPPSSVTVTVAPAVNPGQIVTLSLVATGPGTDPLTDSVQLPVAVTAATSQPVFAVPALLPAGPYLAMLEVDGVASLPVALSGVYAEPMVQLP
jgi:hypothetical protein